MRSKCCLAIVVVTFAAGCSRVAKPTPAARLEALTRRIMAADYEGDRGALATFYDEADAFLQEPALESRARYWKGYTKWRRAMNGANETPTPTDLAADSVTCAAEMRRASDADPAFVDARIGEMACTGLSFFFDSTRAADAPTVERFRALLTDLKQNGAENPRYVWAWGMAAFGAPPEWGGGPDKVIRAYHDALERIARGAGRPSSPLDPAWGEAELHVNLAYSYLNKPEPELKLAREHVDEAVRLAPNWHYAKDILRPQIDAAIEKQQAATTPPAR